MKKLFANKMLVIAVPLVLVLLLVVGVVVVPLAMGAPLQIKISTGGAATPPPAAAGDYGATTKREGSPAAGKAEGPTLPFATRERVVNLADKGGYRYLKVEVVLEIALPNAKPGEKMKAAEIKTLQKELDEEMAPIKPKLEDTITSVLTSKTSEELMGADGKQKLRDELRAALDKVSGEHAIMGVYFTQFIIQ